MKVVIDTNIIISALFFGGNPLEIVRLLLLGKIEATASPKIVEEYLATAKEL